MNSNSERLQIEQNAAGWWSVIPTNLSKTGIHLDSSACNSLIEVRKHGGTRGICRQRGQAIPRRYPRVEKREFYARAQFTPSVRHDGRDRVNHRRKLRRECFTHNLAREHEFTILPYLAKITEDVVCTGGKEHEDEEERKKRRRRRWWWWRRGKKQAVNVAGTLTSWKVTRGTNTLACTRGVFLCMRRKVARLTCHVTSQDSLSLSLSLMCICTSMAVWVTVASGR